MFIRNVLFKWLIWNICFLKKIWVALKRAFGLEALKRAMVTLHHSLLPWHCTLLIEIGAEGLPQLDGSACGIVGAHPRCITQGWSSFIRGLDKRCA